MNPRHGRSPRRKDHRNGYYLRDIVTRFGTLRLRIARSRKRGFQPEVIGKFQRRAEAVFLLIREAFLRGLSTRQAGRVVGPLTAEVVSAQTVSQLTRDLDEALVSSGTAGRRVGILISGWRELTGTSPQLALIVSTVLPKGIEGFDLVDGIWIVEPRCFIPVATALRQSIIELATVRQTREGQQTKMGMVYEYLTGPRFRQRVEAIVEQFAEMHEDLDKEPRTMIRLWAKREEQIRGVIDSMAGMYGDLQGIAGKAVREIEG